MMANKTLNTRQKQVFRAPTKLPVAARGQTTEQRGNVKRGGPPPKPVVPSAQRES